MMLLPAGISAQGSSVVGRDEDVGIRQVDAGNIILPAEFAGVAPLLQGSSMALSVPTPPGGGTNDVLQAVWHARIGTAALIHDRVYASIVSSAPPPGKNY